MYLLYTKILQARAEKKEEKKRRASTAFLFKIFSDIYKSHIRLIL